MEEKNDLLLGVHQALDMLLAILAFWLAYWLRKPAEDIGISYTFILVLAVICSHLSLRLFRVYDPFSSQLFRQLVLKIVKAVASATNGVVFLLYTLHIDNVSRLMVCYFALFLVLLLIAAKALLYFTARHNRYRDYVVKTILIVGSRQRCVDLIKEIRKHPKGMYRILGCLETIERQQDVGNIVWDDVAIIGTMDDFNGILLEEPVDEVIWALPLKKVEEVHNYIFFAEHIGVRQRILPDFQIQRIQYYPVTSKVHVDQFVGVPTLSLFSTPAQDTALLIKTALDYICSVLGLIILSPLLAGIALLVKTTSRGPVFFSHTRCGLNGRRFSMYKFRTMVEGAEELRKGMVKVNEMDGPAFKMQDDPRVTPVGRFLRKTSLDELPQLFNVLKGEMSLVGPRPPLPEEVKKYNLWQRRRLSMKPGLTCIWQVSGRNDITFDYWMKMDLEYIDNWSFWLDVKLILLTVKEVLVGGGR